MVAEGNLSSALTPPVDSVVKSVDLSRPVLFLSHDHRPMGMKGNSSHSIQPFTVSAGRAIVHILRGNAYMVEGTGDYARAHRTGEGIAVPTVIALKRNSPHWRLERPAVFSLPTLYIRDVGTCQYSGTDVYLGRHFDENGREVTKDPRHRGTFDHVTPQCKGGARSWENALLASAYENNRKGDLMPQRFSKPLHEPWVPTQGDLIRLWLTNERLKHVPEHWLQYLDRAPASEMAIRVMDSHAERCGSDMFSWQREEGALRAA